MYWFNRHRRLRDQLSAYIDGELTAAGTEALERHLAVCSDCQQELEEFRATVLALRELPQEELPRSFTLRPEQVARPTPQRAASAPPVLAFGMRLTSAALAFALAAVLVVDLGGLRGSGDDSVPPAGAPVEMAAPQPGGEVLSEGAGRAGDTEMAEDAGLAAIAEETPLTGDEAAPPPAPADQTEAEALGLGEPDGGLDPLRAAEFAIAAALAVLLVGSLTLAYAGRKV
jgi:hypothetical protein